MQLKIITDKENLLLERRKIDFRIIHKGAPTPTKKDVSDLLAAKLNANLDLMFLKHFKSKSYCQNRIYYLEEVQQ